MIGTDRRELAALEIFPQRILCRRRSQRRGAFCQRADSFHILLGQDQVMRTGFTTDIYTQLLRRRDQGDSRAATDMNDVESTFGFTCEFQRARYGLKFGM